MPADPFVAQTQALYSAQSQSEAAARKQAIQRALIDYGAIPDFAGTGFSSPYLTQDIDQTVGPLAQQNTAAGLSQLARMQKTHADTQRRIQDVLGSRGLISSGEFGYQLGEEDLRNKQSTYDTTRKLTDYISGAYQAFNQAEQQRQFGLMQAQQESAQREQERQFQLQQLAQEAALAQQQMMMDAAAGAGGDQGGYVPEVQQQGAPAPVTVTAAERNQILSFGTGAKRDAQAAKDPAFANALHRWRMGGGAVSG